MHHKVLVVVEEVVVVEVLEVEEVKHNHCSY
jgi:hypothetical protein